MQQKDPSKPDAETQMKRRSKKFANYSISELFQIKAYILNTAVAYNTLCDNLDIDPRTLSEINDFDYFAINNSKKPYQLKKNQRI